jgi:hypothetical protein
MFGGYLVALFHRRGFLLYQGKMAVINQMADIGT